MKFSVLMSVYKNDSPKYFNQAVASILNQSLMPNEIILVRDGIVGRELNDTIQSFINNGIIKVKYVELENNVGLGLALSIGMKHVSYDYIARMDSDDISNYLRFETQIKYLIEHPDISVLGSYITEFDSKSGRRHIKKVPINISAIRSYAKYRNPVNHVSVIFRKLDVIDSGGYESVISYEDYYLWLKMIFLGKKIKNIPVSLVDVRAGSDMITRRRGWFMLKNDLNFFCKAYKKRYISLQMYMINIFIRFLVRMAPPKFTSFFYQLIRGYRSDRR
jgi:glycosyltransferase involved in cell wall biosynthesis